MSTILSTPSSDFWYQDMKTDWYPSEEEEKTSTDRVANLVKQGERRYLTQVNVKVIYPLPKKINPVDY
jgi:uncharacterized lipoprotein